MASVEPEKPEGQASLTPAAVFEQYRDRIHRYILGLVHDSAEADDLTQETFLRVQEKLDSLQDQAALSAWLYRIATHVCYDRFRQASYRHAGQPLATASDEGTETQPEDVDAPRLGKLLEQAEMSACMHEFIDQLSDDYRMVILLHDVHGMTNPQIAQVLDCSLDAVKIRLHRARQKLKTALEAGCEFSCDERGVFVCDRKRPNQ